MKLRLGVIAVVIAFFAIAPASVNAGLPNQGPHCTFQHTRNGIYFPAEQRDGAGEPKVLVFGQATVYCRTSDVRELKFMQVCVQMKGGSDNDFHDQRPCTRRDHIKPVNQVHMEATIMCRPGKHSYRVRTTLRADVKNAVDESGDAKSYARTFNCNEAGAFRFQAGRNPSAELRSRLLGAGQAPADGPAGFDAHHIVPAGEKNHIAAQAEAAAYTCGIYANEVENGVFLRGPTLRKDKPRYKHLSRDGKRRAYHPRLRNEQYFTWVREALIHATYGNGLCVRQSARSALAGLKQRLLTNDHVPGSDPRF